MLDTAMSAAAGTVLAINKGVVTLDLKNSYLKPLTIESGPIRAIGRVVDLAEATAYVTGQNRRNRASRVPLRLNPECGRQSGAR